MSELKVITRVFASFWHFEIVLIGRIFLYMLEIKTVKNSNINITQNGLRGTTVI